MQPYICPECGSDHFRTARLGVNFQTCNCKKCNTYWVNYYEKGGRILKDQHIIAKENCLENYD